MRSELEAALGSPSDQELRFDVDWLTTDGGSGLEAASYGALTIRAGDHDLTAVVDTIARTTRSSIRVSLHRLALWLAGNWWRQRWEPEPGERPLSWRMAHEMGAIGGGFVWPSMTFTSDGEQVHVATRASRREHTIRYLENCDVVCSALSFERGVDDFVSQVLARQQDLGVTDSALGDTWQAVRDERADPTSAAFRKREAMMGLDPGQVSADDLERLFAKGAWIGAGALDETLVETPMAGADALLDRLEALRQQSSPCLAYQGVLDAVASWTPASTYAAPWQRGAALAAHLRRHWGLGHELISDEFLSDAFGGDIHSEKLALSGSPPFIAFREDGRLRPVLRHTHFATSRRFDIARLIGDAAVAEQADALSPLTRSRTARQKFQRAAAQELLCPVEGLVERVTLPVPDEDELVEAAQYYQVSEHVVATTLVNHRLVSRDYLSS